jgi:hypothetical protein
MRFLPYPKIDRVGGSISWIVGNLTTNVKAAHPLRGAPLHFIGLRLQFTWVALFAAKALLRVRHLADLTNLGNRVEFSFNIGSARILMVDFRASVIILSDLLLTLTLIVVGEGP